MANDLSDGMIGCLVGLACGDAVGTTVEFMKRGTFAPVTDMVGGGHFRLPAGYWTDDTSMALCLGYSLLECGFDPVDQMTKYLDWYENGYMSSTGKCFDIGTITGEAVLDFRAGGSAFTSVTSEHASGNGSLMRVAPIAIHFYGEDLLDYYADLSSRTTHGSPLCRDACRYFATLLSEAFVCEDKDRLLHVSFNANTEQVESIVNGEYLTRSYDELQGSGYVIESLESALWCFYNSSSFEEAILLATNIGNDADTTATICGQIAGAFYGHAAIPDHWKSKLFMHDEIYKLADDLL